MCVKMTSFVRALCPVTLLKGAANAKNETVKMGV